MAPLALLEITSGQNFSKIGSYLGEKGPTRLPETPPPTPPPLPKKRGQISWMLHQTQKDLKIYNLAITNATLMIYEDYVYTSHTIAEDV